MKVNVLAMLIAATLLPLGATAKENHSKANVQVSDKIISQQRDSLAQSTKDKGFGPQSPRDIGSITGSSDRIFSAAPAYTEMNLCNIHFHKNAEHKGGDFQAYAGNGDGQGFQSGYVFSGNLSAVELRPVREQVCANEQSSLYPGDTIEVHYVHSTAQVQPGPTLGSCLSKSTSNPQLRVEAQVVVLVSGKQAQDFGELTKHDSRDGLYQAFGIPDNTGTPIEYIGSTTGPDYNTKGSPFQVTWNVRPKVTMVDIETVGEWCKGNVFNENHAHGVRNLVTDSELLSKIEQ